MVAFSVFWGRGVAVVLLFSFHHLVQNCNIGALPIYGSTARVAGKRRKGFVVLATTKYIDRMISNKEQGLTTMLCDSTLQRHLCCQRNVTKMFREIETGPLKKMNGYGRGKELFQDLSPPPSFPLFNSLY